MHAAVPALTLTLLAPALAWAQEAGTAEENLKRHSIQPPAPAAPGGNYVRSVRVGNLDIRLRRADGTWLFYRDMVSPVPPPDPKRE